MDCCLQTCEISENEACGFYQKYVGSSDVERLSCGRSVPSVQKVNHIGTDLDMIIKVAEKTNSEYLEKLKELRKRFENCRRILNRYYYQLLNID